MKHLATYLRYDWPLHFVLLFTDWLPDNVIFLRLRGWLAHFFFGACGRNLRLGRRLTFLNPEQIFLGNDVFIAYGCWISAGEEIHIDHEVMLGPYCVVISGNHQKSGDSFRYGEGQFLPIHIGRGSWIAAHSVITAGSNIGEGCLVAANAVVTKGEVPDNAMVGGVPARFIEWIENEAGP